MVEHLHNTQKRKFYHKIDKFLFYWTNKIRESNVAVIKSFLVVFFVLILLYIGLYYQSKYYPVKWSFSIWEPDIAIPTILTITGLFFTIIVLFAIAPKKTQTGDQFLYLLIDEINSLKSNDEITIISPNINIGTTTYPALLESLIESVSNASAKGAKIYFLTLSLHKDYLDKFVKDDNIATYSTFYNKGTDNNSNMLAFLGESYNKKKLANREYENTIDVLRNLLDKVHILEPNTNIINEGIVGFLSNTKFYIGKHYPDSRNEKHITVKGEVINTPATVQMLKEHFIKDL